MTKLGVVNDSGLSVSGRTREPAHGGTLLFFVVDICVCISLRSGVFISFLWVSILNGGSFDESAGACSLNSMVNRAVFFLKNVVRI